MPRRDGTRESFGKQEDILRVIGDPWALSRLPTSQNDLSISHNEHGVLELDGNLDALFRRGLLPLTRGEALSRARPEAHVVISRPDC